MRSRLRGGYATISPEILAHATTAGYTIAEAGITHSPRTYGRQTGSDLKVVIAVSYAISSRSVASLRKERVLAAERPDGRELAWSARNRSPSAPATMWRGWWDSPQRSCQ